MKHTEASSEAGAALLRQIPAVDELLARAALRELAARLGRRPVVDATRRVLESLRGRISNGDLSSVSVDAVEIKKIADAESSVEPSIGAVINSTGVARHRKLVRATLAPV